MIKDSSPDMVSDSEHNANIITPSDSQEEILHPNDDSAMDGGTSSKAISASLSNFDPESPSESLGAGSESGSEDSDDTFDSDTPARESDFLYYFQLLPEVCQSRSMQWQFDNMFSEHCVS